MIEIDGILGDLKLAVLNGPENMFMDGQDTFKGCLNEIKKTSTDLL